MNLMQKISTACRSLIITFYYTSIFFFAKRKCIDSNSELVVSLTSYGKRLRFVFLTIESIFNQSYKPAKIILWVFNEDKPKGICKLMFERMIKRGLTINYVDRDVRSFKKLSFILDKEQKLIDGNVRFIVTADDDIFYPSNWLEGFHKASLHDPRSVLCYRARNIIINEDNTIGKYNDWGLADKHSETIYSIMPTGVSGVCYPIDSLDDSISDFDVISELCPYADDIWYKMITTKNGYASKLVLPGSVHFIPAFTGFSKGLEILNVLNKRNDNQFIASMGYFGLNALSFKIVRD